MEDDKKEISETECKELYCDFPKHRHYCPTHKKKETEKECIDAQEID